MQLPIEACCEAEASVDPGLAARGQWLLLRAARVARFVCVPAPVPAVELSEGDDAGLLQRNVPHCRHRRGLSRVGIFRRHELQAL